MSGNKRIKLFEKIRADWSQVNKNLLVLFSIFLLLILIIMLISIFVLQSTLTNSYMTQKEQQERFFYWTEKVEEYPNSPDVLYNAAVSAVRVNREETALRFLNQAFMLDPLFVEAKKLQKEIIELSY